METTRRALWVSEGPHLVGRFIKFDLRTLLDPGYDPAHDDSPIETISQDDIAGARYDGWVRAGAHHSGGGTRERSKAE
jgi:hypothetical protein